ncbi:trigger factor [Acidaminobacter hydrogenoformans]|uniref:Trigger factor n=1 Tax=Acidaminobacter hydrogenoformans DSM 2784 TaxID=1120920 RepID=A0A1G5RYA2_9FIRM|nr:trigger factor [Acidaminobacter hydrogenoformans]SCZ78907.1 trigger factor [Acidaminobacter hydrogenoformans DSM 2784]
MAFEQIKKEGNNVTLEMTVSAEAFEKAIQKVYNETKARYAIPGFRKGKVPRAIIEKQFGEGVFFEDAINELLPGAYSDAIDALGLEPVAQPDIDVKTISKETGLVIEAAVTVKPEATIENYKGVEVKKVETVVTEEEVDQEIEKIRDMNARLITIEDRPVQTDDTVTIDYAGSIDGVAFDGGTAEGQQLVIGSGQFIPGFEEQLIGANLGDHVAVKVSFPETYHAEELAGKEAVFEVDVKGIRVKELPEMDDELAKDTSEFDTLEELRADIKAKLVETAEKQNEMALRDSVIDAVVANLEADIPDAMVETEIDYMIRDFDSQLRYQGLDLDGYMKFTGGSLEDLKDQMRSDALARVKTTLAIEQISKKEAIAVTDEDLENEFVRIAERQGTDVENVKKVFASDNYEYLKNNLITKKTVDFLVEQASFTE